jgi:hypothetical protein
VPTEYVLKPTTFDERAEWRDKDHQPSSLAEGECRCGRYFWPCPTARLLHDLDDADKWRSLAGATSFEDWHASMGALIDENRRLRGKVRDLEEAHNAPY